MPKPINDTPYCPSRCQGVNHEIVGRMVEAIKAMVAAMEPFWYEGMGDNYHLAPEYKKLKAILKDLTPQTQSIVQRIDAALKESRS